MKLYSILLVLLAVILLSGCWIGDTDDASVYYDTTVIEELCQTPELSMFCDMIYLTTPYGPSAGIAAGSPTASWILQFSGRTAGNCPSNVETVFAPSNDAITTFLSNFPHWNNIYDIPMDTVDLIVRHHLFLNGKLLIPTATPECTQVNIVGGVEFDMWQGKWIFLINQQQQFIAASLTSGAQTTTPIISPDLSSSDGCVYIVEDVLSPF